MNQNRPTDSQDRELVAIDAINVVLEVKSAPGETVTSEIETLGSPVSAGNPLPVAVTNNVTVGFDGSQDVNVQNFPADPASGSNQTSANTKLDAIETATEAISGKLPPALIGGLLGVIESNSPIIFTEVAGTNANTLAINNKTPAIVGTSATIIRGSATTSSVALTGGPFLRGFMIRNMDATKTIYWKIGTVTTANGHPIDPGQTFPIELSDPTTVHVITSAATSAYSVVAFT